MIKRWGGDPPPNFHVTLGLSEAREKRIRRGATFAKAPTEEKREGITPTCGGLESAKKSILLGRKNVWDSAGFNQNSPSTGQGIPGG